jgi:hypothetical protein
MLLIILIIVVGLVYLLTMQGITCCNSGSLYALVRAIVEKRTFKINDYLGYTKYMDYAKIGNDCYSDRPPGLAFAAVPFYFLGIRNVTIVSVISGVLASVMVYLITNLLVGNELIAFSVGLIFALCTLVWRYSTTFIIHPLSAFLVLLSVYLFWVGYPFFVIGLILGFATIVEYTDFLYLAGLGIFELIFGSFWNGVVLGLGYVVGVFPLLFYNWKCFGSPFTTSYKHSAHFKWSNSFKTTFVNPMFKGIFGLFFHIKKKGRMSIPGGILVMSPVLIFGMIGFYFLEFKIRILFLLLTLPLFLLISKHKTWWAGGGGDHRYLISLLGLIVIPIGLFLDNFKSLWPLILFWASVSFIMVVIKMLALTITSEDLNKLKNRNKIIGIVYMVFQGLFIRKINLEKYSPEIACKKIENRNDLEGEV